MRESIGTYMLISRWLIYLGVKTPPEDLMTSYKATITE
jgi:hypothetical protein